MAGLVDLIGDGFDRADIVGDDDLDYVGDGFAVGDELDQLLAITGAAPARGRAPMAKLAAAMQARKQAALRQHFDPRVVAVASRRADRQREYPLGFDSVSNVVAGAVVTITSNPQVVFRGERLIIPSNIATGFLVVDVKIGKDSQFVAPGSVPAVAFSEVGVGVRLKCDTAQPGVQIAITVQNVSGVDTRFLAAFIGTAVE